MTRDLAKAVNEFKTALITALKLPQIVDWLANEIGWVSRLSDAQIYQHLVLARWGAMTPDERIAAFCSKAYWDSLPIEPYKGERN